MSLSPTNKSPGVTTPGLSGHKAQLWNSRLLELRFRRALSCHESPTILSEAITLSIPSSHYSTFDPTIPLLLIRLQHNINTKSHLSRREQCKSPEVGLRTLKPSWENLFIRGLCCFQPFFHPLTHMPELNGGIICWNL